MSNQAGTASGEEAHAAGTRPREATHDAARSGADTAEEGRTQTLLEIAAAGDHVLEVHARSSAANEALAQAMNRWKGASPSGPRPARSAHWTASRRRMVGEWIERGECAQAHGGTLTIEGWERMEPRTLEAVVRSAGEGVVCARRARDGTQETKVRKAEMTLVLASTRPPRKRDPRFRTVRGHTIGQVRSPSAVKLRAREAEEDTTARVRAARERALTLDGVLPARLDEGRRKALRAQMSEAARDALARAGDADAQAAVMKIARTLTHLEGAERTSAAQIEHARALREA